MDERVIYFIFSSATIVLVTSAAFCAWFAMKRGLTYESMKATVGVLVMSAVAHTYHAIGLEAIDPFIGNWSEIIEYSIYIVAYATFIKITWRALLIKVPKIKI